MPRCERPSLGGDDAPIAELARELTDQSLGCVAHWCRYECQSCGSTHAHSLWLKDAPHVSFLNKCVQLSQRANVDFKPLIDQFSALEYATKYATKQESRLEFTTRTGVEDTDGSAETVRSACALAPPCRPAAETRARSRVRRASRHASAGASLSPPPNKWCLAQSGSQCAAALSGCPTFPPASVHDWEAPAF